MPRYKKGTLVRVLPDGEGRANWDEFDTESIIEEHGWLFLVQKYLPAGHPMLEYKAPAYECKSLSTGDMVQLFREEITTRKEKSNDANKAQCSEAAA